MFMTCNDNKVETKEFIKSVTYHLDPSFKPSVFKVTEAPFNLSRVGWGYFEIEIEVEFQEKFQLPIKKLSHMLSFENEGHTQNITLEIGYD